MAYNPVFQEMMEKCHQYGRGLGKLLDKRGRSLTPSELDYFKETLVKTFAAVCNKIEVIEAELAEESDSSDSDASSEACTEDIDRDADNVDILLADIKSEGVKKEEDLDVLVPPLALETRQSTPYSFVYTSQQASSHAQPVAYKRSLPSLSIDLPTSVTRAPAKVVKPANTIYVSAVITTSPGIAASKAPVASPAARNDTYLRSPPRPATPEELMAAHPFMKNYDWIAEHLSAKLVNDGIVKKGKSSKNRATCNYFSPAFDPTGATMADLKRYLEEAEAVHNLSLPGLWQFNKNKLVLLFLVVVKGLWQRLEPKGQEEYKRQWISQHEDEQNTRVRS